MEIFGHISTGAIYKPPLYYFLLWNILDSDGSKGPNIMFTKISAHKFIFKLSIEMLMVLIHHITT